MRSRNLTRRGQRRQATMASCTTASERALPSPRAEDVRAVTLRPFDERMELAARVELGDDVAAAHELAAHVELGDGRPVGELFDAFAHLGIVEHVDVDERLAHLLQ